VTGIGSLPFRDPLTAVQCVAQTYPRIPFWPELPSQRCCAMSQGWMWCRRGHGRHEVIEMGRHPHLRRFERLRQQDHAIIDDALRTRGIDRRGAKLVVGVL